MPTFTVVNNKKIYMDKQKRAKTEEVKLKTISNSICPCMISHMICFPQDMHIINLHKCNAWK